MVATPNQPVFQVSEFIEVINRHLMLLGEVVIEGEISRLDVKNGQLIFATIKDKQSSVDVFSLVNMVHNLRELEPGMLVHVFGKAGLYKGSGKFRLFASKIVPEGEGSLQLAYEKLKAQLLAEGLFAPERKRPLPVWPREIGLITATGSSAQADLLKILSARMSNLHLMTLPVNVQGREAVTSILKAFKHIDRHPKDFDLIIMARGGGSLEDLAAFNSEEICRAVYACKVPVVSAIGHEDNWSLTDYVADLRASTPSNAAELVVRDRAEVTAEITQTLATFKHRLVQTLRTLESAVNDTRTRLRHQVVSLSQTVTQTMQRVPVFSQSLKGLLERFRTAIDQTLPLIKGRLTAEVKLREQALVHADRLLVSLDYRQVLKRGYSLTTKSGHLVRDPDEVNTGDEIETQLYLGKLTARIIQKERKTYV